jgi:hypothetical protein
MKRNAKASARVKARIAGGLWLIVMATGGFAAFVSSTLIVRDPATTATNIVGSERLFRLGFAANLAATVCYIGVTVILYDLLKAMSRTVSLLAAFLGLAGSAAGAASSLALLVPLILLGKAQYLSGFTHDQLKSLAFASLSLNEQGFNVSMLFFGFQCVAVGYLIVRSTFLPRVLGALLAIGGSTYVISSFANFVAPAWGSRLSPFIIPAAVLGEGSLCLWLLVMGVNLKNWEEQSSSALPDKELPMA